MVVVDAQGSVLPNQSQRYLGLLVGGFLSLGLPIVQSSSHLYTLGPKVDILDVFGALIRGSE